MGYIEFGSIMYLAEIRGKLSTNNENKEDILTSNVFSFFKYASRNDFLYPFILSLGVDITPDDALDAEFRFWPRFVDSTEPDLVILIGDYYLLFEAKFHSGFGEGNATTKHQLIREIEGGDLEAKSMGRKFRIYAVTKDYYEKPEMKAAIPAEFMPNFQWLNWQAVGSGQCRSGPT